MDHNESLVIKEEEKVEGIILSGGKGSPYEPLNLTADFVALMNYDVPTLGLCLGYEIIAVAHLGRIKKLEKYNQRLETELREQHPEVSPAFHFNKQHWNGVNLEGSVGDDLLKEWIDHSYTIVVDSLPRSKREALKSGTY